MSVLSKIIVNKTAELVARKQEFSQEALSMRSTFALRTRDFRGALAKKGLSVIGEIKKASPSRGVLANDLEPGLLAVTYETAGADALSVLTDRCFFSGGLEDLVAVKSVTNIPVLRKDFIIDEYQIYESKAYGADAVLLIAGLHPEDTLISYLALCRKFGLAAVVEAHTEEDVAKALSARAGIIGINNRDLNTFEVDIAVTERLLPGIPKEILTISESGIRGRREANRARAAGADALLVGEALVTADDIAVKMTEIKSPGGHDA